jgi:hypothetical protein
LKVRFALFDEFVAEYVSDIGIRNHHESTLLKWQSADGAYPRARAVRITTDCNIRNSAIVAIGCG